MDHEAISEIGCTDDLFTAWKAAIPRERHFNGDGIISKSNWDSCPAKVLFILKETNQAEQNIVSAINKAIDNSSSGWWRGKVLRRVGRWAYGLQTYDGTVSPFKDAVLNEKHALRSIAYINIKKTSGGAITNAKDFDAHAQKFAVFVRKQVNLIQPNIVVLCGTYQPVKRHIFPELKKVSERVHTCKGIVFINAFHPAARKKGPMLYHQVLDSYHTYKNLSDEERALELEQ